jgi:hypothetical protein
MPPWSLLLALLACAPEPMSLPAEAAVEAQHDRGTDPPLYRKLYDYAFLPQTQLAEQRVRIRIWLHYMEFDRYQLGLLQELTARTLREKQEVERRQSEMVQAHEPGVKSAYDDIWAALDRGAPESELATLGTRLDVVSAREAELRSVRTLFEAQKPFLATLTPTQDAKFADAVFLLRHRLDPYANPGDFNALVGPIYVAGEYGTLSKTTFDPNEDHLNIGGLWSDQPVEIAGAHFPDARREVILYMVCLEPALTEAVSAEIVRKPDAAVPAPVPGQAVAPGVPEVAPGVPVEPAPGVPEEPPPAPPGSGEMPKPG